MKLSNYFSRIFGVFARTRFYLIQNAINSAYCKIFNIDLREFDDISTYKSLLELFTRELKIKRVFSTESNTLISPTDSYITALGECKQDLALQIKGMEYSVSRLFGEESLGEKTVNVENLKYINLYLSPKDYHHYHSPCDILVYEVRYFPGVLLPVNIKSLNKNKDLFAQNERVILFCKDNFGDDLIFVAVGAFNVGVMKIAFLPDLHTNSSDSSTKTHILKEPIKIQKGEKIGKFEMGSTVLLFVQNWDIKAVIGENIKYTQTIAYKMTKEVM